MNPKTSFRTAVVLACLLVVSLSWTVWSDLCVGRETARHGDAALVAEFDSAVRAFRRDHGNISDPQITIHAHTVDGAVGYVVYEHWVGDAHHKRARAFEYAVLRRFNVGWLVVETYYYMPRR